MLSGDASPPQAVPVIDSLVNSSTCLFCSVMDLLVRNPETKRIVKSPTAKQRCLGVLSISVGHL